MEWGRARGRERKSVANIWFVLQIKKKQQQHLTYIRLDTQKINGHIACVDRKLKRKLSTRPLFNSIFYLLFIPSAATSRSCGAERKPAKAKGMRQSHCLKLVFSFRTACMSSNNNNMWDDGRPDADKGVRVSDYPAMCYSAKGLFKEVQRTKTYQVDGWHYVSS